MFSDSALSCILLFLASGSSIYILVDQNLNKLLEFQPNITAACVGVFAINLRSTFNLLSPFIFYHSYSIDPIEIANEEKEKAVTRVVPFHEKFCRVLSNAGFLYYICESHDDRKIGICLVSILALAEIHQQAHKRHYADTRDRLFHFLWMYAGGLYGWIKGNNYCFWAYLPYGITFLAVPPETDRAWSIRRIISNYMMMAHMFLMLEAGRN